MSSSNAGAIKKMSLEEFLGDDTLGDSVWNEDDINLDAISNTTNIDFLKVKSGQENADQPNNQHRPHNHGPFDFGHKSGMHGYDGDNEFSNGQSFAMQGPPYIIKFSQLPPKFSDADIHDLFHEKFTKFVKFKLFWELNKNPSIDVLKSGTVFDQNFRRTSKAGFVELYTGRDMDKILKYWSKPLLKIHNIKVEPAEFDDFKEYRSKIGLLTDPKDDAGKPYILPRKKSNPFGAAKPVDTQSKILAIEDTVEKLHIEDTKTLRRLSGGDNSSNLPLLKPGKVQILKKPAEETKTNKKPLRYVDVMKKKPDEEKPITSSGKIGNINLQSTEFISNDGVSSNKIDIAEKDHDREEFNENLEQENAEKQGGTDNLSFSKDLDKEYDPNLPRRSYRGGRGGGFSRGNNNRRGGGYVGSNRPPQSRYNNQHDSTNENSSYQNRKFNNNRTNQPFDQGGQNYNKHSQGQSHQNFNQEEKSYSMFKPASQFLWENGKSNNGQQNTGGGFNQRGSHRGSYNNRGRHKSGFTSG